MEVLTTLVLIATSMTFSIYMITKGISGCLKILRIDQK
jgi:hypothetical protein